MARKHEHFGLSYLEELNIVKGRENICKESRHEFMKFKQEFTSDHGNVNKALQEVTPPSQSLQIRSKTISPFLCSESKQLSSELDTSGIQKKIRIACDDEEETIETEDTPSQPKKSSKKQNHTDGKKRAFHSGKTILEHKSESPGDEVEKMPVLIASFVGTTKQMTILKKPGPLKPKSPKIPCAKLRFKGQSKDSLASSSKPLEQKILSQHIVLPTAGTSSADFDDTSSVISSVNEKSMTISKEDSESNVPSCLERSYSTKGSASSSIKFAPAHLEETISESRLGLSKSHLKSFSSYSKSQVSHSISKLPSGIVSRSIDEIIESLKSTVPTDSDLKIKELLESILGQDYLIKIQQSGIKKEMQPNELELPAVRMAPVESDIIKLKPSHIRKDRSVSPSAYQGIQLIPEDSEQEIPESSQARSISYSVQLQPSEMREHIAGIEVTNGIMPTATEESDYVFKTVSLEQQSIHESEIYSFSEIEETPESIVERSKGLLHLSSEEKLEDFASSSMGLIIQGKAFPKARPVEIQKSVEDLQYQQPVSLLSTWTTKIKEVDYPLIHLLCTTSPGFVLPSNLRLVSRVYHTIDKAGHGISLPPINFDCHNSEGLFPVTAAFEEQIYRERIYNEGLPISEVCQSSQEDGIQVLPPKSPRSMPEWQRIAEFYVEKPQLKLLGKKMKLQPGSLKMFWTPAPHKFSAPLSVMKEILFSKYESNLVHGVIYEDFSIDLQEKEKAEDEDDVDYLFSNISANGRCGSFPELAPKAIHLEPLLANAHWHRHLIFIYQNKILPALEDLNFVIKYNISYTDAYLSRAQIYRKQGKNHLAMINYTLALRYRPTDPEIYYKRGEVHEEEGELILAMEDYSKCLYYDPQSVDACMKHGIYYFNKSNWTIAMNDFTTVIKKDPKHAEARTYRARIYIKQEQYKNAAEDLSAAIHLNPRNWIAFYYRGCILRKIDPKQSLQDLSVSVLLNHRYDNIGAYLHRGILYAELKQWPLAICDFENAIALDRSLTTPYINIGLITMLHSDQYFDAILRFTEAIRVDPLDVRPYLCRAQAYQKVHDLKNSVKDINRAIHLHPNLPHLFLTRGQYLLQMKHFQLASFCIHQVAEMDKGSLGCSLVQEALVQSFCQNYNKAIECAIAATRNQPEPALYNLLGKIQMKAKKFKDALSSLNEALMLLAGTDKCLPNTFEAAELYFLMGQCYMEQVFLLEACDAFTSAVRLYPRYADAFYQRGLCRMQLQQAKCILDFNKTLAIVPRHFQAYISRAAYYGSKGRYSKAIMNCTEALKIEPCSVRGYLYRGVLKFYNRTYKHAVEDLTKAIKLDKVCTLAYYNRAIAFQQLKDYEHSLIDYETVLHLETNKDIVLKVLKNRALVYIEMKRYDYALKDFAEVAMIEQKNTELLNAIGLCYHRLQKYEEAVESFSKVLKLNPFVLDAYIGRGNAYLEYGHSKGTRQALKDFLTAVHINPVCIKARLCLGYSLQALGKFQKAWTQFSAAIHCDPSCHIAYDGRAIVCLQMGDIFAAFQDTNAALKIITNAELLTNRGVINQFMGYLNCAMRDYQQAITIDPNYALAYFNAANVYFLNKQFSQANDYYDKAIELDPQNESAFLNRAITNTLLKKFEEAKTDFEKAISLSPLSAAIYFNKANLYSMLQQYEQAEEDISKALSIQPYDALMYKLRADIRGKMGLIQEAIADYKKAISIQELINSN
ncbi:tetratricopeptide repeat protein 6 isoform X4 [Crotalus tigris]|uniref:tetratricopeptide repeat protein 6 isoform X4 n=1 Tax=Crotalus tigris TaxID=88082 RepID=UPI00192F6546|nr:tetratricopeptide repeat protein 6 isoform X4 [Crotalus tigris]